jgi:hypothetical protein
MTALHIRNLEKIPISIDEMKDGSETFMTEIDASEINDKDDEDA